MNLHHQIRYMRQSKDKKYWNTTALYNYPIWLTTDISRGTGVHYIQVVIWLLLKKMSMSWVSCCRGMGKICCDLMASSCMTLQQNEISVKSELWGETVSEMDPRPILRNSPSLTRDGHISLTRGIVVCRWYDKISIYGAYTFHNIK